MGVAEGVIMGQAGVLVSIMEHALAMVLEIAVELLVDAMGVVELTAEDDELTDADELVGTAVLEAATELEALEATGATEDTEVELTGALEAIVTAEELKALETAEELEAIGAADELDAILVEVADDELDAVGAAEELEAITAVLEATADELETVGTAELATTDELEVIEATELTAIEAAVELVGAADELWTEAALEAVVLDTVALDIAELALEAGATLLAIELEAGATLLVKELALLTKELEADETAATTDALEAVGTADDNEAMVLALTSAELDAAGAVELGTTTEATLLGTEEAVVLLMATEDDDAALTGVTELFELEPVELLVDAVDLTD